jgi:hypothetical protein
MEFVKIPRSLIYDTSLGDKRIIAYSSILFHDWDLKRCDIPNLVQSCGYCADRHSDANEQHFYDLFNRFAEAGYIEIHNRQGKSFTFFSKSPRNRFGIIYKDEYIAILKYRESEKQNGHRINHANLLLLLSYIRLNMEKRPGMPVAHYSMLKTISENIGLSVRSISAAAKILELLSIIHSEPLPRYQDEFGNWHTNVKVFVNMQNASTNTDYDWHKETQNAINSIIASQRDYIGG